jgi:hypothetical protein
MTIKELIEQLQKFDPATKVFLGCLDYSEWSEGSPYVGNPVEVVFDPAAAEVRLSVNDFERRYRAEKNAVQEAVAKQIARERDNEEASRALGMKLEAILNSLKTLA